MILVTGGAGYIGSVLSQRLTELKLPLRIFDQFYFGENGISDINGRAELVKGNILNFDDSILDKVDTVIHLAALSNDPMAEFNPEANRKINTLSTIKLAKKAKKMKISRFIFGSSCSIYDQGLTMDKEIKSEESKVFPRAAYSHSKYKAERELLKLSDNDFSVIILRKGTVYGYSPRMRFDLVVNTMVKDSLSKGVIKIYGGGIHWRPLIDVEDVASAYYLAMVSQKEKVSGKIFNIAFDNFLVKDLAFIVQEALDKNFNLKTKIVFEENNQKIRSYKVSTGRARRILKFLPKINLENSIIKMVKNLKKNSVDFDNPIYYNIDWMRPILEKEYGRQKR